MTRNLKALGLALVAVFAMSAMAASGAHASEFTAEEYPVTAIATTEQSINSAEEYFEAAGRKVECEVAHFTGEAGGPSETLTVTPKYTDHAEGGNCKAGGLLTTTVTENGCKYVFHAGAELGEHHFNVGVSLDCPPEETIEVHVGNSCQVTIHEEPGITGNLTALNDTNEPSTTDDVTLSGTVEVHSTLHSNSALICGKSVGSHAVTTKYVINDPVTVTGQDHEGNHIGIDIG